ncbi:MAG: outer membrane protein assembly factor BamA [Nitrospirae bacterium]|nr:outer membrane protein assembly factor BamA [Nitrospirota bacterium]
MKDYLKAVFIGLLVFSGIFFAEGHVLGAGTTAAGVTVRGLYSIGEEELLDMLGLRPGTVTDGASVRRGIKTAFLKGIFEDISVSVGEGDPADVVITVRERDRIRKVYLSGDFQLSGKLLRAYSVFKEDDIMRYDLIRPSIDDMKRMLGKKGFPSADISIETKTTGSPYRVDVYIKVDTGPPLTIKTIRLDLLSAPAASGERQRTAYYDLMKVTPGDVYDSEKIEKDITRIREFLKKQGHIKPQVGPHKFSDGDLEIPVDPGRRLEVDIEGNSALSTKTILKAIALPEIEDFSDDVIAETVDRILALYHAEGYPSAQAAPVTRTDGETINLSFFIFEGDRQKIASITFDGSGLPHDKLKAVMTLKENEYYNPDLVEKDREALRELYGALGYLEAAVRNIEVRPAEGGSSVDLLIAIDEGEKTEISSVEISGAGTDIRDVLASAAGIKPGDPYNEVDISDARLRILEYYNKKGHVNISVSVQSTIQNHRAAIVFSVTEGGKRYLGRTVVFGNNRTKYRIIRRELLHKEGGPYNLGVFAEEKQKLYRLGLFTDVEIEAVDLDDERSDVLIKVKEGNAGSVEFGAGYAEQDKFRGFLQVSYRNLWGMNREGLVRAEVSSLQRRFLLQYNEPWFLNRPLPLRIFLQYDRKKELNGASKEILYQLTRYSFTAGVEKKLSGIMKAEFYYEFSLVRTADVQPDVVLSKEDTGTLAISSIKPAIVYDTRDNPFDPGKGMLAGASLKLASSLLLSETNFAKLEVYASRFHRLSKALVLAASVRSGVAYHFGTTHELPIVERFFLGGRSTVRGFEQDTLGPKGADGNPTGGNFFLMGNLELRASLGKGFGLVPFVDMGNVWVSAKNVIVSEIRYTSGLGLRYETPVGPLRVDYGFKLKRQEGESRGALHFSIGHAF